MHSARRVVGTRLLDGRCLVTILFLDRLVRFLPLELGRCLVTFRSLERLVTLFRAGSSFGDVSPFFDYVVMFLSLEIGCRLVMLFVLLGHVSLCGAGFPFGHGLRLDGLIMFLSLKPSRCLVTFRSLDSLVTFLSLESGHPMGPEPQNTTL